MKFAAEEIKEIESILKVYRVLHNILVDNRDEFLKFGDLHRIYKDRQLTLKAIRILSNGDSELAKVIKPELSHMKHASKKYAVYEKLDNIKCSSLIDISIWQLVQQLQEYDNALPINKNKYMTIFTSHEGALSNWIVYELTEGLKVYNSQYYKKLIYLLCADNLISREYSSDCFGISIPDDCRDLLADVEELKKASISSIPEETPLFRFKDILRKRYIFWKKKCEDAEVAPSLLNL
jgi:hypothetical protein